MMGQFREEYLPETRINRRKYRTPPPGAVREIEQLLGELRDHPREAPSADAVSALGFLRRVPESVYYRPPPAGPYTAKDDGPKSWEIWECLGRLRLSNRVWGTTASVLQGLLHGDSRA